LQNAMLLNQPGSECLIAKIVNDASFTRRKLEMSLKREFEKYLYEYIKYKLSIWILILSLKFKEYFGK